jgi:hypothetical protein
MYSETRPSHLAAKTTGFPVASPTSAGSIPGAQSKAVQVALVDFWGPGTASGGKQSTHWQALSPSHTSPRAHATPRKEGASLVFIEQACARAGRQARSKVCTQALAALLPGGTDNNRSLV